MTKPAEFTLAERVLIVPAAHTRVTDVAFQTEMYELFHRTAGARIGHMLGTPVALFGIWMLVAQLPMIAAVLVAGVMLLVMTVWAFSIDRLAGAITMLGGAALCALAFWAAHVAGGHTCIAGAIVMFAGCASQTFSHLFEDVPPPQSGAAGFVPMARWMRAIDAKEVARSTALTFAVFYWLELWATPRIWPLQILHLAMRAGYRPALRRSLDEKVAAILATPESPWRRRTSR